MKLCILYKDYSNYETENLKDIIGVSMTLQKELIIVTSNNEYRFYNVLSFYVVL